MIGPPSVDLTESTDVPVNADNDNGSAVTNGIPANRDFAVYSMPKPDPDILKATITVTGLPSGGAWTTTLNNNGAGRVLLWQDQTRTNEFDTPPAGKLSASFYIEGDHESSTAGDVVLWFNYRINGQTYSSNTLGITVTPLISSFTVTPGADANDNTGQNVIFDNGIDGSLGLDAETPGGINGANFKAVAVQTGLNGNLRFIQNIMAVVNGNNGTKNAKGTAVGWLYQDGTADIVQLLHPGYPILDVAAGAQDQTYITGFTATVSSDDSTVTIAAKDSPSTATPGNGGQGIAVDYLFQARLYLVWKWNQVASNSGGQAVPVFYTLAYNNWQVNFWGTTPNVTGPITKINVLKGVTADKAYTTSNVDPPATALDLNRYFNNENRWVSV